MSGKKILYGLLFTGAIALADNAVARTDNNNVTKTALAGKDKVPPAINPQVAPADNKPLSADDTLAMDPDAAFYTPKKKRNINIPDLYVGLGAGYIKGSGGANTPFNNGLSVNGSYGIPMINKYLILEFDDDLNALYAPNTDWFSKAFSLPRANITGVNMGFTEEFSMGLHVVLIGSRNLTLSAGPFAGGNLTNLPSMNYNGNLYYLAVPMSFCYGLKTNLFISKYFYCYAQYSNSLTRSLVTYTSQTGSEISPMVQRIPVDFGVISVGVSYLFKPWW